MAIRASGARGLFTLFTLLSILSILSSPLLAQSAAPPPAPPPLPAASAPAASTPAAATFEVADVHASPFDRNLTLYLDMQGGNLSGDRYIWRQATMTQIIAAAYNLEPANVQGGPSWLDWERYDIVAKAPPTTSKAEIDLMLQSLLAKRFGLVAHTGSAPMPAYMLTAQNGKTKLKESEGTGDSGCKGQAQPANQLAGAIPQILVVCSNETMEKFAELLHMAGNATVGDTSTPVVNSTGLTGAYDFDLKWTPRQLLSRAGPDGISIFDALDKQLGLKLTLETAPRPVLIVDSVNESPTPNVPDLAKRMPPLPPPQFEVAVVKRSKPDEKIGFSVDGDEIDWRAISIQAHILFAWDINFNDRETVVGAPKWLGEDTFDILAKLPSDDSGGDAPKAPQLVQQDLEQMLRGLIENRFQMKYHWETRPITAYRLVAVSSKLTPADLKARARCENGPGPDGKDPRLTNPTLNRLVTCQNITMRQFGVLLQSLAPDYIYSPVLDDTGLKGSYNFTLSFSSISLIGALGGGGPSPDGAHQPSEPNGAISLSTAIENQLGLKLEKGKRPLPVLVIDHIEEQPTAN